MSILIWIIFGGLVGWVASLLVGNSEEQGIVENIVFGIVGAMVGGFIAERLAGQGITGFNVVSFMIALVGALTLVVVSRLILNRK